MCSVLLVGCLSGPRPEAEVASSGVSVRDPNWPDDWGRLVGQRVTVEGVAENWPQGAFLASPGNGGVWIEDFRTWPGTCFANGKGKRLRVTGEVSVKQDVPQHEVQTGPGGAAVRGTATVRQWGKRYLLKHVQWHVQESS